MTDFYDHCSLSKVINKKSKIYVNFLQSVGSTVVCGYFQSLASFLVGYVFEHLKGFDQSWKVSTERIEGRFCLLHSSFPF